MPDTAVDLIIMATHGVQGMEKILLGSVADRVVKQAPARCCSSTFATRRPALSGMPSRSRSGWYSSEKPNRWAISCTTVISISSSSSSRLAHQSSSSSL